MTGTNADVGRLEAVVLAGGLGTRLAGVLGGQPKALAPIGGRPFVTFLFDWLARASVARVVLSTGHLADRIEGALGRAHAALPLAYAVETTPLGTAGAIVHAAALTRADPLLVLNGDSFVELDLAALVRAAAGRAGHVSIAVVAVPDGARFGTVQLDPSDRVVGFHEKTGQRAAGWINAGVYMVPRAVIADWPATRPLSFEHDVLPAALPKGVFAYRCAAGARFIDIGTPESLAEAERFFAAVRP